MSKLRVLSFGLTVDGFGAGPSQDIKSPLGVGGESLLAWLVATRTFRMLHGDSGGDKTGIDEEFASRGFRSIGAWIMGRNMFGPVRGPWPNFEWKGWWGDNPPFHSDVFVVTHFPRPPLPMEGGTTFHFETEGIESVLKKATQAANGKDVRLGGGVSLVRQYLMAGLVDEIHLAIVPTLMGSGEHLLHGIDLVKMGYRCVEYVPSPKVAHMVLRRIV